MPEENPRGRAMVPYMGSATTVSEYRDLDYELTNRVEARLSSEACGITPTSAVSLISCTKCPAGLAIHPGTSRNCVIACSAVRAIEQESVAGLMMSAVSASS